MAELDFAKKFLKELRDDDTFLADSEESSAEFSEWIDTGSYSLNALISGSIYGGVANTKRIIFASLSGVGKTFLCLSLLKSVQDQYPDSLTIYYDTESAVTKQMMLDRNIDPKRVIIAETPTVEKFRAHALKVAKKYLETPETSRPKMNMVLDSIGNLATEKELDDTANDKNVRDMTRPGLLKGAFRMLNNPLAKGEIPMFIANHLYTDVMNSGPGRVAYEMSGGTGARFCADTIVYMTKAQDKNQTTGEVYGSIVTATLNKSRFTRDRSKVKVKISYTEGLDRYYGLVEIGLKGGLFKSMSKKIWMPGMDVDKAVFESHIYKNPEKYFTKDVLDQLDVVAGQMFKFGGTLNSNTVLDEEPEQELLSE